jgi:hypothetical protein
MTSYAVTVLTSALLEVDSSSLVTHDLAILQLAAHWLLSRQQGQYIRGWIPTFS